MMVAEWLSTPANETSDIDGTKLVGFLREYGNDDSRHDGNDNFINDLSMGGLVIAIAKPKINKSVE